MTQLSNVPMQLNPNATERLTLIEKLERELAGNCRLNNWDLGFKTAIDIVKQHQAESGWVAYEDERKPKDKSRVLAFDGRREFIALYDKGFYIVANGEYYGCVTHWMELPLPPHDSKGGAYEQDLYQIEKEKGKFFEPSEVQDD